MTLEQAILVFKTALEELERHSAIGVRTFSSNQLIEIQLYEYDKLMELPGELVVEERSDYYYPFCGSKTVAGIKLFCLYETDPREEVAS